MPFAAFMSLALYDHQFGYYTGTEPRVGWRGDFVTSPELDPAFGALWARGFHEVWELCGRPPTFEVVEIGPGEGTFAASVLGSVAGRFADALTYRLVERSGRARSRQQRSLAGSPRVEWSPSATEVPTAGFGCVFANEVIDNLPVHLVTMRAGRLLEVCVAVGDGVPVFVEMEPSNPELERFVERCGVTIPDGHRFEVALAAESFVARVAAMFERGCATFVDYGDSAEGLAARPEGSLVAYSAAGVDDRVLEAPGEKDITTHANWTAVTRACERAGLRPSPLKKQRDVLVDLGLHELHDHLKQAHDEAVATGRGGDAVRALSRRQALGAVADPNGLGGLDVLVAARYIDTPSFAS